MGLFHRKSQWERLIAPIAIGVTSATRRGAVRNGLTAAGVAVGMSVASAVVSSVRRQREAK